MPIATIISKSQGLHALARRFFAEKGMLHAMLSGVATVAVLTLVAKGMSFVKDAAVAHRFGTSDLLDAFLLSFSLLSFLAAVVGGGLPEAFLPAYAELRHRRGMQRAQRLAVQACLWNLIVLSSIALVIYVGAPWIIEFTGRGFSVAKRDLAIGALRSLIPFLIFYGLTFHLSSWLRADKKFVLAASAPLLPPAVIFIALLFAGQGASVRTLVIGTNVGVFVQLIVLLIALSRQMGGTPKRCFKVWEPSNRAVLGNAIPYFMGGLIMNSAVIVDQAMAAWLTPGSVSVLTYSDKVCGIVLALTATAASEAVFPFFADSVARREWALVKRHLLQITGTILLFAVPVSLVFIFFAPQIVGLLFERGSFTATDTAKVAGVMRFAAMQIPFYIIGILASRVAVSMQATRFTLFASIAALACNVGMNWFLMQKMGVAGIALSTAFVHLLSAVALYIYIFRRIGQKIKEGQVETLLTKADRH